MPVLNYILRYLFYPNPGQAEYTSMSMLIVAGVCAALIIVSFVIRFWRKGLTNPVTRKLSKSWSSVSFWFGVSGLLLVVCRVERIQFLAMRFLWVIWALLLIIYVILQIRLFRMRHYEVIPMAKVEDPRDKYLPKKKKH